MSPVKLNFKIYQGSTFNEVLRWESSKKVYKPITAITQAAPCVVTSTGHALPDGWRVKITNVGGMTDINSADTYHVATKLTADTIELNSVNSLGFKAYTTGGVIEYNEPINLTGYSARMQIREKIDSAEVIKELTTENGGVSINTTDSTITLNISAVDTAAFTFTNAVYSLEMVSSSIVTPFANGTLTLIKEVTR
jgi:tRNA threonylcarbamoyladenosine modification (KEOPS) complex  Pcc1 subunit